MAVFLIVTFLVCWLFGLLGQYIAVQKNRPDLEGFLMGFFLGPLGWLIEALLPTVHPAKQRSRGSGPVVRIPAYEDDLDEPRVESSDGIDMQALAFLNKRPEPKLDALGEQIARGLSRREGKD